MDIVVVLQVEVERDEGKFASREELEDKVLEEVTGADPSTISTDEDATYSTTNWEAETYDPKEWAYIVAEGTKALQAKKQRAAERRAAKISHVTIH